MASLTIRTPDGKSRTVELFKAITRVGRSPDNDIQVEDGGVPDNALHVVLEGSAYRVGTHTEAFQVNGKRRADHVLAPGDVIRIGASELEFRPQPATTSLPTPVPGALEDSRTADSNAKLAALR